MRGGYHSALWFIGSFARRATLCEYRRARKLVFLFPKGYPTPNSNRERDKKEKGSVIPKMTSLFYYTSENMRRQVGIGVSPLTCCCNHQLRLGFMAIAPFPWSPHANLLVMGVTRDERQALGLHLNGAL